MQLENVDENEGAEDNDRTADAEDTWIGIKKSRPDNYSTSARKSFDGIPRSKPETVDVGNSIPRRRGRPPGSGTKSKSKANSTAIGQFWIDALGLGLILTTGYVIAKPFNDKRYLMTAPEAKSAATAMLTVGMKYKIVRDTMSVINMESDAGIIIKGFAPYIMRAFLKEIIEDVISGLTISGPKRERQSAVRNGNDVRASEQNGKPANNNEQPGIPEINVSPDWRAL